MPNWVYNKLIIDNDPSQTKFVLNRQGEVDFNLVAKIPSSLENAEESSSIPYDVLAYISGKGKKTLDELLTDPTAMTLFRYIVDAQKVISPHDTMKRADDYIRMLIVHNSCENVKRLEEHYAAGQILSDNFMKYGCMTWYDWTNANWGCKWNASDTQIAYSPKKDLMYISFSTPWTAPVDWAQRLCQKNISFNIEWIEETGYHGEIISDGTTIIENDLPFIEENDD